MSGSRYERPDPLSGWNPTRNHGCSLRRIHKVRHSKRKGTDPECDPAQQSQPCSKRSPVRIERRIDRESSHNESKLLGGSRPGAEYVWIGNDSAQPEESKDRVETHQHDAPYTGCSAPLHRDARCKKCSGSDISEDPASRNPVRDRLPNSSEIIPPQSDETEHDGGNSVHA